MHFLYQLFFGVDGLVISEAFFWIPLAIGAALGAAKNMEGQAQAKSMRGIEAAKDRYSPWTGLHGQMVRNPSLFGDIATGAAIGATAGSMAPAAAGAAGAAGAAEYAPATAGAESATMNPENYSMAAGGAASGALDPSNFSLMQGAGAEGAPQDSWLNILTKNAPKNPYALYSK